MSAHTPAPWVVLDRRATGGVIQIQAQHRGPGSSYCVAEVNFYEQPKENAALIAAAPELLAALREAVEEMDAWMLERTPDADDIDKLRSDLRAAIAKATDERALLLTSCDDRR